MASVSLIGVQLPQQLHGQINMSLMYEPCSKLTVESTERRYLIKYDMITVKSKQKSTVFLVGDEYIICLPIRVPLVGSFFDLFFRQKELIARNYQLSVCLLKFCYSDITVLLLACTLILIDITNNSKVYNDLSSYLLDPLLFYGK